MARGSAAWVLVVLAVVTGVIGTLLLTVTDPVMQALFDSGMWTADTTEGSDLLGYHQDIWTYWPVVILLGIMLFVWLETRQPT